MKRLTALLIILGLISISIPVCAFDWQSLGASVTDKKEDGPKTILTLKDEQNRSFKVTCQDETVIAAIADKIIKCKDLFYSWRKIRFKEVSFVASASFLEIIVVPVEIVQDKTNLAKSIPAGITMTYYAEKGILRYDFRMMKDNLVIRIAGDYLNEDEMLAKLAYAYENPLNYLRRTDPEYLSKEVEDLRDEVGKLRQALVYLNNEDWLGRYRMIPPETIKKIIELKKASPAITPLELWQELKKAQVKITKQELRLILLIYYNETP